MANRRMFSRAITETDAFLDMPPSSRALYFHLGMNADDDGVVDSPKRTIRASGATDDDMRVLIAKRYLIPFESGVMVVRHWKQHNHIQADRYHKTIHQMELSQLVMTETGEYAFPGESDALSVLPACIQNVSNMDTECIQDVSRMDTEVRLGKASQGKASQDKKSDMPPDRSKFTKPTIEEVASYVKEISGSINPRRFIDYYESVGWTVGKNSKPMRDWKAAVRSWQAREQKGGGDADFGEYAHRL